MKFRKSIRIGKGLRVNLGKKGITSVSVGGKGLTLNASAKGIRGTASIPGTGISDSTMLHKSEGSTNHRKQSDIGREREVGIFLFIGIFFIPYIFSWFTLRKGHSNRSRILSFLWLFYLLFTIIKQS